MGHHVIIPPMCAIQNSPSDRLFRNLEHLKTYLIGIKYVGPPKCGSSCEVRGLYTDQNSDNSH